MKLDIAKLRVNRSSTDWGVIHVTLKKSEFDQLCSVYEAAEAYVENPDDGPELYARLRAAVNGDEVTP